ncbi:hypothetical protein H7K45_22435 [Mycobacterium yunnanensis]|uniref:Secreted protein n=1 Tax=Mycobacterium yunnanensis TaxID=368477 RepID=A0A9X2Z6U8_9MYCO|nr:CAP domain-containing protein [Mycobacterium yunnanensis]MCV7423315.1 hypothetical protein [Mycobacterium yunnanensis]
MSMRLLPAVVGATLLAGIVPTPVASADDPLPQIRGAVNGDRSRTGCPALAYDRILEDIAQTAVRPGDVRGGDTSAYKGTAKITIGWGDPEAAAINDTYEKGAGDAISNCSFTEFGVGFNRNESLEWDSVSIVFGTPAVAPPPAPTPPPSSTPAPAPPKVAPTDAVRVSFDKGLQWTVNVTSTADIAGTCTYAATNPVLPGTNRTFAIQPRGSASFTVLAPPPFSTYHVVVSCSGPFDGKTVEFGHVEQDVSA